MAAPSPQCSHAAASASIAAASPASTGGVMLSARSGGRQPQRNWRSSVMGTWCTSSSGRLSGRCQSEEEREATVDRNQSAVRPWLYDHPWFDRLWLLHVCHGGRRNPGMLGEGGSYRIADENGARLHLRA